MTFKNWNLEVFIKNKDCGDRIFKLFFTKNNDCEKLLFKKNRYISLNVYVH